MGKFALAPAANAAAAAAWAPLCCTDQSTHAPTAGGHGSQSGQPTFNLLFPAPHKQQRCPTLFTVWAPSAASRLHTLIHYPPAHPHTQHQPPQLRTQFPPQQLQHRAPEPGSTLNTIAGPCHSSLGQRQHHYATFSFGPFPAFASQCTNNAAVLRVKHGVEVTPAKPPSTHASANWQPAGIHLARPPMH